MRLYYRAWQSLCQVIFSTCFKVRAFGRDNVPANGPALLVCNHQSYLDPIVCGLALKRELNYIARASLFRNRYFSRLIRSVNAFPIQRDQADLAAIRTIINRLQQNRAVLIFPESTRTPDGRIRTIKSGIDLIVRRSRTVTIPVIIDGAFEAWPRHRVLCNFETIRIVFGQPITHQQARGMGRKQFVAHINQTLRRMQTELRLRYHKKPYNYNQSCLQK